MPDKQYIKDEKKIKEMERKLTQIYSRADKELGAEWKAYMDKGKRRCAELKKAVDDAKTPEEKAKARKAFNGYMEQYTLQNQRYKDLTDQYAKQLSKVNETAVKYINDQLPGIYGDNVEYMGESMKDAIPVGYSYSLVDENTVKHLIADNETLLPYKKVDTRKDVRWNTEKVNSEVLQGILQGESIDKIKKRLYNVTEMNKNSAYRNARTSVTSAENKGRIDMMKRAEESGVISHKVWMSAHDGHTREAHLQLDGQEQPREEPFSSILGEIMYPGDPDAEPANVYNCRCTLTYKIVGFKRPSAAQQAEQEPQQSTELQQAEQQSAGESTSKFVPASSTAEAEEYAKQFLGYKGKVSYKGIDTEYANACNEVLTEVFDKFDISKLHTIEPMNMRQNLWKNTTAEAAYRWGSGDLYINPKYYKTKKIFAEHKKEIDQLQKTIMDGGQVLLNDGNLSDKKRQYVTTLLNTGRQCVQQDHDFVKGTFVHECGHMLDDKALRASIKQEFGVGDFQYQEMLKESRDKYGVNISGYAVSDNAEYVAETFSAWWFGEKDKCDPRIIKAIEGLLK